MAETTSTYDPSDYPPFAVTVDICLLTVRNGLLSILLIERGEGPFEGSWALPGGFVQVDEGVTTAAQRELAEETGVGDLPAGIHLEQLATFGDDPARDPRMRVVSVAHVAFAPDLPEVAAGGDASAARWWPVADLEGEDGPVLAFDHAQIIKAGVDRARAKLEYTTLAVSFVDETFTLGDLQRVYEAVWGVELSRQAFAKKVLGSPGFVDEAGGYAATGGRPAKLYQAGASTYLAVPFTRPAS